MWHLREAASWSSVSILLLTLSVGGCSRKEPAAIVDFSGTYSLVQQDPGKYDTSVLRFYRYTPALDVTQREDAFVIKRVDGGQKRVSYCPLRHESDKRLKDYGLYTAPDDSEGDCASSLKGKQLDFILVVSEVSSTAPSVVVNVLEHWQLSDDRKTLTIESEVEFEQMRPTESSRVGRTATYKRVP
jgi:hypothetical protein